MKEIKNLPKKNEILLYVRTNLLRAKQRCLKYQSDYLTAWARKLQSTKWNDNFFRRKLVWFSRNYENDLFASNQLTSQKIFGAFIGTCKIDSNSICDVSLAQPFTIPSHLKNQANRVEELDVWA